MQKLVHSFSRELKGQFSSRIESVKLSTIDGNDCTFLEKSKGKC